MSSAVVVSDRRWTLEDRAEQIWWDIPFDVPEGCAGVTFALEVDEPDAVVDLGCSGSEGWRGWSGGARRTAYVGEAWATPGYLAGPLEQGTWNVVLGLHRVPPGGLRARVTVELGQRAFVDELAMPAPGDRPERRTLPAPRGMQWLACDFHAHTLHSDGALSPGELANLAGGNGLDVLAITDHNTTSHHASLEALGSTYGIGLIPGQEVTTDAGHANAFGDIGFVDFRQPAHRWVEQVAQRGGLLSINHPLGADCAWRWPLSVKPPMAEIWHSSWLAPTWGGPLAWWEAWGLDTIPLGGSDFHRLGSDATPGSPTTWVCVDASAETPTERAAAVISGLAAGRTAISRGPHAPVALTDGDAITVLDASGALLVSPGYRRQLIRSDRETFGGCAPGGHYLIGQDGGIIALTYV